MMYYVDRERGAEVERESSQVLHRRKCVQRAVTARACRMMESWPNSKLSKSSQKSSRNPEYNVCILKAKARHEPVEDSKSYSPPVTQRAMRFDASMTRRTSALPCATPSGDGA
jgi:hypothetical protein